MPTSSDTNMLKRNPRFKIEEMIMKNNLEGLLLKAAEIHGHYCPGLAMGVKAATYALRNLKLKSKGMEEVIAVVETNSCFSDGIQYVTGCTFGNNALIYRDYGKTAVTITDRNHKGLRIKAKDVNIIEDKYPQVSKLFQKVVVEREGSDIEKKELDKKWADMSFSMVKLPFSELLTIQKVKADIPEYAPIFADEYCSVCGEKIMAEKAIERDGVFYCIPCAEESFLQLDGRGLSIINEIRGE